MRNARVKEGKSMSKREGRKAEVREAMAAKIKGNDKKSLGAWEVVKSAHRAGNMAERRGKKMAKIVQRRRA